jgi:hypothetical protein
MDFRTTIIKTLLGEKIELQNEEDNDHQYHVRMNAQNITGVNRTRFDWSGPAKSDKHAHELALAHANKHGMKNITVKEISKLNVKNNK